MMSKEKIVENLFATLAELQSGTAAEELYNKLCIKLETLSDILGDDVPEEYWEQIEELI